MLNNAVSRMTKKTRHNPDCIEHSKLPFQGAGGQATASMWVNTVGKWKSVKWTGKGRCRCKKVSVACWIAHGGIHVHSNRAKPTAVKPVVMRRVLTFQAMSFSDVLLFWLSQWFTQCTAKVYIV